MIEFQIVDHLNFYFQIEQILNRTLDHQDVAYHQWRQQLRKSTLEMSNVVFDLIRRRAEDEMVRRSLILWLRPIIQLI